ncbi:DUF3325 domain-containing protein [Colwellia sp. E150_009]|jgi:hypothetical protein
MILLMSLCFVSMSLFCLAMDKHRKQILSPKFINVQLPNILVLSFKPLAWLMLLITLTISVEQYGWSIGPAVFFGALSGCLLPLILLLTYRANLIILVSILLPIFLFVMTL